MNIAVIVAGGVGARTGQSIPKQFINVGDKPIIIYTMERFQKHPKIDAIEVVCLEGWLIPIISYAKQFGIDKLKWTVPGGNTVQESLYNGIMNLKKVCSDEDIVVIHDGVRPFVSAELVSNLLDTCRSKGNACTSQMFTEQIFFTDNHPDYSSKFVDRSSIRIVQTPQAYRFVDAVNVYEQAFESGQGLQPGSYINTTMVDFGYTLYLVPGVSDNIKITTKSDIELFKVLLRQEKAEAQSGNEDANDNI